VSLTAWQVGIQSTTVHSDARIKKIDSERVQAELDQHRIVIVTGFQGVDRLGDITTLGRGGSDTSAVALAAAFRADLCQIYTDVEGVYTADPRIVPNARKMKEISAFIVEKGTPGFTFGTKEKKMGIRGSSTYELIFQDCRIPKENLLGQQGKGFNIAMHTLDGGRIGIASQALGIAEGALERTIAYVKERKQFGRAIGAFQNTQFQLADMATKVEAAQLLVYKAAMAKATQKSYSVEAAKAKLYAAEVAMEVTTKAVQLHGGYGYTREYEVERMMRDAKITEIYEGTSEVQRMVISGALLK